MDREEFVFQVYNQVKTDVLKTLAAKRLEADERKRAEQRQAAEYAKSLMNPPDGLRRRCCPATGECQPVVLTDE